MTSRRERGHSLVEITIVVIILAILAVAAVPTYRRAEEQSRVDACAAALRSVWSAQRAHWLETHTYAPSFDALVAEGNLDAAATSSRGGFRFRMTSASPDGFGAEATRSGSAWNGVLGVDASGDVTGDVAGEGGERVAPGLR